MFQIPFCVNVSPLLLLILQQEKKFKGMEKLVYTNVYYKIWQLGKENLHELAEFVVMENYKHHIGNFSSKYSTEIEKVYQEELQYSDNSTIFVVRNVTGKIIGSIRVFKWDRKKTVNEYVLHNQKCYANSYSMSVLASGECTICEMLYDNEEYLIGNIRNQSLYEIWNSQKALDLYSPLQRQISEKSPCHQCSVFDKCRKNISKRVCYVDIAKINKQNSFDFPDPRCPMAKDVDVVL